MRPRNCLLAIAMTLVSACGGEAPEVEQPVHVAPPWAGSWSSPPCGERWFERRIELRPDGEFDGVDRVAPCMPGMQCLWPGIVIWSGTWAADGDRALLDEESVGPVSGPVQAPRPTELVWDSLTDAPAEETGEGELCPYSEVNDATTVPASEDVEAERR